MTCRANRRGGVSSPGCAASPSAARRWASDGSARSSAAWAIIVVAEADQVEPGQPCRVAVVSASVLRASMVRTSPEVQAMTPSSTRHCMDR